MSEYDRSDIEFYVNEINKMLEGDSSFKPVEVPENSENLVNDLGESLSSIMQEIRRRDEEEFDKRMRQQRYDRGYADIDVWDMSNWFIETVGPMLMQLRDTRHGSPAYLGKEYVDEDGVLVNTECHEEWTKILNEMLFLLGEMKEETRSVKNPYDEEYERIFDEYEKKYGMFRKDADGVGRFHSPREIPEYKAVIDKYFEKEKELKEYSDSCKDKFFELFSKHFWALWD